MHTETIKRIEIITKLITFDLGLVTSYQFLKFKNHHVIYPCVLFTIPKPDLSFFQLRKCTLIVDEVNKQILYPTQTSAGERKESLLMNCTIAIQGHTDDGSFIFIFSASPTKK